MTEQVRNIIGIQKPDMLILREKELNAEEYQALAIQVLTVCDEKGIECVLHSFVDVAQKLGVKKIHLPLNTLKKQQRDLSFFQTIGVSVHSREEAEEAYKLGATYLIAGHIFATDCKAGLPGRGLEFLRQVCEAVPIPVYGIGGINNDNTKLVKAVGAAGECRMSYYMKLKERET